MKTVYPVILSPLESGYLAYVPYLEINTTGKDIPNAIEMARDAIGITMIGLTDLGQAIPTPDTLTPEHDVTDILTLVDIDYDEYRRASDNRSVRTNVTLPSWLKIQAEKESINFSQVLQDALKERLNVV